MQRTRCSWCTKDTLYETYHDSEWGKKETSGRKLFESVCLEGHQSGLSWLTILKRRENRLDCCTSQPDGWAKVKFSWL